MPVRASLIVVIVRDAGLRSALAARLALSGITLLTARAYRQVRRQRLAEPAVLLIDEAAMAGAEGDWVEALWLERRWARVIVLTMDGAVPASDRDWLRYVDRNSIAGSIDTLLAEWGELPRPAT